MEKGYIWQGEYGKRSHLKPLFKELLKEQDTSVKCQTTGIICTKTGTILHVLDHSHVFSAFKVGND